MLELGIIKNFIIEKVDCRGYGAEIANILFGKYAREVLMGLPVILRRKVVMVMSDE